MSRFIQQEFKKPVKETKEIPVKAGTKGYDYSNLANGKKIPTKGGWK